MGCLDCLSGYIDIKLCDLGIESVRINAAVSLGDPPIPDFAVAWLAKRHETRDHASPPPGTKVVRTSAEISVLICDPMYLTSAKTIQRSFASKI